MVLFCLVLNSTKSPSPRKKTFEIVFSAVLQLPAVKKGMIVVFDSGDPVDFNEVIV